MDAPLPADARAELDDLRRRAYGPGADIHSDNQALERLQELEEQERVASQMATAPAEPAAPSRVGVLGPATPTSVHPDADLPGRSVVPVETVGAPATWWRRLPLWVLLVGVALVGVGIGVALPRPSSASPTATVSPVEAGDLESDFLSAEALDFFDLDDGSLIPFETFDESRAWSGVNGSGRRCLFVVVNGQWMDGGCTPLGLPLAAEYVDYDESATVDGEPPAARVVRYVQRPDGRIDVWVTAVDDSRS